MADVNKTVSINYTASTENLERQLKKIPNITDKEMNKAVKEMDGNFKDMEKSAGKTAKSIGSKMKSVGTAFATVGASIGAMGAGVVAVGQKLADLTNELVDASSKTGIAVNTLAGLRIAAEGSGIGFSMLEGGLIRFQQSMDMASKGTNDVSKKFAMLGVDVTDLNGNLRDSNSVFNETMTALSQIENETQRNATAMQLFGRTAGAGLIQSGALTNLDQMTKLASEFGIQIDEKAIGGMGQFQRSIAAFEMVAIGTFQRVIGAISGQDSGMAIAGALDWVTRQIIRFGSISGDVVGVVGQSFENLAGIITIASLAMEGKFEQAKQVQRELSNETHEMVMNLGNTWDRASERVDEYIKTSSSPAPTKQMKNFESSIDDTTNAVEKLNDQLEQTALTNLSSSIQQLDDSFLQISQSLTADFLSPVEKITREYDNQIRSIDKMYDQYLDQSFLLTDIASKQGLSVEQQEELFQLGLKIQRLDELKAMTGLKRDADLRKNAIEHYNERMESEQKIAELQQRNHENRIRQIQEQIDLYSGFGENILTTMGSISTAISDVSEHEIEKLTEQADARIAKVEEMEKRGVISSEMASLQREHIEQQYNEKTQKFRERQFKANQATAIADVIFQGAVASIRALADYGLPAGLAVSALAGAQMAAQLVSIRSQTAPKFDVGGMVGNATENAPDQVRANLLKGEAVLDRATVQRIGGEQGVKRLQRGQNAGDRVIVIQPFKHFDRFAGSLGIQRKRVSGIGGY
jgi:hypothetical protein